MLTVTFSKNAFFPLTRTCRNECTYCNFRKNDFSFMSLKEVRNLAKRAKVMDCKEALLTFGERPDVYPEFRRALRTAGYSSFLEYVCEACRTCIDCGLIPHTNAGILLKSEMRKLKPLNGSMGLMLEQAVELDCHKKSPGKDPEVRIKTIERAGKLEIPFTTGLLIGIGESEYDRIYSLEILAEINRNYGHIQEVIVQPLIMLDKAGKSGEKEVCKRRVELREVKKVVEEARKHFEHVQVPPNLFSINELVALIKAGANDLGGISPVTPDYINPMNPWPSLYFLRKELEKVEISLRERLPVYDEFIRKKMYGKSTAKLVVSFLEVIRNVC